MNKSTLKGLFTALMVLLVDRITKSYALVAYAVPQEITNWLSFDLVYNRGISWGIWHEHGGAVKVVVMALVFSVLSSFIMYTMHRYRSGIAIYPELMVIAGACSNFYDRIYYPGVIDFIHVHTAAWHWPIFNIADCAISIGIFIMLITHYRESR